MSRWSKLCFVIAAISILIMAAVYFMIMVWLPILYFFLFTTIVCVGLAVALDWRLYFEFLTLRTTKYGMNMGVMILLTITGLVCVNYLGVRFNKTFDLTHEKLYSLSDQTRKLLTGLPHDIQIKIFYKGPTALSDKAQVQKTIDLYKEFSSKVKIQYYNSYVDQADAQTYLATLSDRDASKVFAFVEYGGKRIRVQAPFDENQFTGAMVKATRNGEKKVYFLKGHGERELDADGADGLKSFKDALESEAFKTESLNLLEVNKIPDDADLLAIVGPKTQYLEPELAKLREYAANGGRLLIAVDPGVHHNFAGFLKSYGIQFMNNYIISLRGNGPTAVAVAILFAPGSKVTQDFQTGKDNVYAVFDLASELQTAPDVPNGLKVLEIVKTSPYSLAVNELSHSITEADVPKARPYTVGIEVSGRIDHDKDGKVTETNRVDEKNKQFEAVVYGDSAFVSNQSLYLGVNRDLALNSIADLAHEADIIGERPKSYKGTVLDFGRYQQLGIIAGGISLPIFLLILSGVMWFRRRGA